MATKFENLSPQEVLTSKAIRWTRPTGRRIIIFCARHQLSQNTLDPYLLGRLMVSLGWSIEMPAYKHLAKRVARYITAHVTADKLSPAFSETKHGSSYTVTWRSYTEHWNENSEFDPDSIDPPPGDDGSVREPVTREYLTLEKCVDQLAQMRMNGDFAPQCQPAQPILTQADLEQNATPRACAQQAATPTPAPSANTTPGSRPPPTHPTAGTSSICAPPTPSETARSDTLMNDFRAEDLHSGSNETCRDSNLHQTSWDRTMSCSTRQSCHQPVMPPEHRVESSLHQAAHPVLRSIALCMAEHSAQSVDSALDYIMNNPYAPSQVLDALKNAIAASDIIEQGKSLMRAKDIEIEALQERARSSLGLEQIHTVEELFEQLRNQLELKDSRIESLGQALEKEQREASIRDQQQAEISDLHVRINGLNAELEMFRNALHTTQQDVQAKDECLRNGLEQNKALTSEVEASRARIQEMNSLTDSLHKARSEAVKDQQKLLEQGKEIETLRHRLAATKEERIIQQLRELSASNDSLTFKLLEQNKQLNDLVVGGPSKEVKDDGKFQKGLGASMWATRPGPPRAVPRHQRSQEDARQESMQQGDGLDGTSKPASSTPPHQRSQVHGRQDPPPQQRDRSLPRDNHHNEPSNIVAVANPPDYGWPETSRRAAPPQHSRASMQQATPPKTPPQQHYASARWDLDSAGCDRNYHGHPIAPPPPSRSGAAGSARSHLGDVRIGDVSEPDRHDSRYITATPVRYASGRYDSREPDRNDSHETRRYDSRYDASPPRAYISGRHGPHEPARYDSPYDTAPPAEYTSSRHNPQYDIESPDSYVPGSGSRRSSRYFASNAALETRPPLPPPSKRYHGTILEHESYGGPESDGENDGW